MEATLNGIYRMVSDDPEAELEVLREVTQRMVDEQRVRLNEQHPEFVWWADLVFFAKDMNATANLLLMQDSGELAELITKLVGAFCENVLERAFPDDPGKVVQMLGRLVEEGKVLDGLIEKEVMMRYQGAMEQ